MGKKYNRQRKYLLFCFAGCLTALLILTGCTRYGLEKWKPEEHLELSRHYMSKGDFKASLEECQTAYDLYPRSLGDQAMFQMGLIYAHPDNPQRSYQKAENAFEMIVKQYPYSRFKGEADLWLKVLAHEKAINQSDAYDERILGMPFDYEGSPRQALPLIEAGIARGTVHDRRTAGRVGCETTGHALPYPSRWGPMPCNLRLEPGDATLEDMVAGTERGLLVSRFWYDNLVDPRVPILTGMTRDGTFLVEGGKITRAVKNLRYNERLLETFSRVKALGSDLQTFRGWGTKIAVPAMKVEDFHFTGCSKDVPAAGA